MCEQIVHTSCVLRYCYMSLFHSNPNIQEKHIGHYLFWCPTGLSHLIHCLRVYVPFRADIDESHNHQPLYFHIAF